MATILIKFTDENQYDASTSTIVYSDSTPKRWTDVFGKLQIGDNCIFHSSTDKLYIGDFSSRILNVSVTFNNIRLVNISLDDFLRINEIIPETLSEFKRPKGPIFKANTINVNSIYNAAVTKYFISFYVVKQGTESQILPSLKDGDRIVTIDSKNRLIELFNKENGALSIFNLGQDYFKAKGKTLHELTSIMSAADKPNHIANIRRIVQGLSSGNFYKFPSFTDYYNIIHNKSIYSNITPTAGGGNNISNNNNLSNTQNHHNQMALNTILYGPPGTGKTYSTIETALKLLGETTAGIERSVLKQKFEDFQNLNRIYFTTFHQNVAYEDFIEGIKPVLEEEDQVDLDEDVTVLTDDCKGGLKYAIEPGLFKKACAQSAYLCYLKFLQSQTTRGNYSFDDLYDSFISELKQKLKNNEDVIFDTITGSKIRVRKINKKNSIIATAKESKAKNAAPLRKEKIQKLYDKFKSIDEITSLKQVEDTVEIQPRIGEFYALFKGFKKYEETFNQSATENADQDITEKLSEEDVIIKFENGVFSDAVQQFGKTSPPVVFIIDEINRGNVSSVFGELITLIEQDKRWGEDEKLKVLLPYSKKHFFVPNNLYIIGTMNTADRSVEALDTALRRRFSFVPKLPEENKLDATADGIELGLMLTKINQRLKVLKDQDHTIGHAWFWNVNDLAGLRKVFSEKIIPLLQEYFYNDYEKLGLVLGDNFFKIKDQISSDIFAKFSGGNGIAGQYDQAWQYELKLASELSTADFQSLYKDTTNSTDEDQ